MADRENDLHSRIRQLEDAVVQQATGMTLLAGQLHALLVVNTALVGALRDRGVLDIDLMHAKVLEAFGAQEGSSIVVADIDAMFLKPQPADARALNEAAAEGLKDAAQARFKVMDGGASGEDTQG